MEREYGSARLVLRSGYPTLWRVLVGKEPTEDAANALAQRVRAEVGSAFVVRLDEPRPRCRVAQLRFATVRHKVFTQARRSGST